MTYYLVISPFTRCRISPVFDNITDAMKFQLHIEKAGEIKEIWTYPEHVDEMIREIDRANQNAFRDWLNNLSDDEQYFWGIQRLS